MAVGKKSLTVVDLGKQDGMKHKGFLVKKAVNILGVPPKTVLPFEEVNDCMNQGVTINVVEPI
jgi:hypothetical protein